jgi:hypothetical protein
MNILLPLKAIAFDELKNDQKNPIEQCKTLNPVNICPIISSLHFVHLTSQQTILNKKSLFCPNISLMLL